MNVKQPPSFLCSPFAVFSFIHPFERRLAKFITEGCENINLITCDFLQPFSDLSCSGGFKWSLLRFLSSDNLYEEFCWSGFLQLLLWLYYLLSCACEVVGFSSDAFPVLFSQITSCFPFHVIVCVCVLLISRCQMKGYTYTYRYVYQEHWNHLNFQKWLFYWCL